MVDRAGNSGAPDVGGNDSQTNPCGIASIYPVSYTHLRAHETVLDLVCRLLLEKKKTPKDDHA